MQEDKRRSKEGKGARGGREEEKHMTFCSSVADDGELLKEPAEHELSEFLRQR